MEELIRIRRITNLPIVVIGGINRGSFAEAVQYTIDLFKLSEKVEEMVKDMGVKLAVATGLPEKLFLPCLENNGVLELFDVCCSTDEVKRGKEYPDIFAFAAQKLDVCPEQCLVFDDVLPAVRSAKQSGMLVCGVYDKYSAHHRTEMEQIADGYLIDFKDAPLPDCED